MILDEYLISLGFKIDEDKWKNWRERVSIAGHTVAKLGIEATGAAIAVSAAVDKIAKQYDTLYFVSQRVNSSVQNIRGFEYAGKSVGIAYDQARSSIEAFATATRMNPGLQGLLKQMGVGGADPTKQATALVGRLKQQFGEGGYFVAARMAGMYGLDEQTFKQLWTNYEALNKQQAEFARRTKESGVDMQDLAKKSRDYVQAQDNLLTSLGLITDQMAAKWMPQMTRGAEWLDKLAQGFIQVGKTTDGWSSTIISLVAALGTLKVAALGLSLIPGMGGIAAAMGAPSSVAGGLAARLTGPAGMLLASTVEANAGEFDVGKLPADQRAAAMRQSRETTGPSQADGRDKVMKYFMAQGWSQAQAAGIAANVYKESSFKPDTVGDGGKAYGLGQWHPDRQANFKKVFGKDIRSSSFDEQLAFIQWELNNTEKGAGDKLRATTSAVAAGASFSKNYERPANTYSEMASRGLKAQQYFVTGPMTEAGGASPVSISQKTDIHVNGSGNPAEVAKQVQSSQDRVNGDLVRNTKGAVR